MNMKPCVFSCGCVGFELDNFDMNGINQILVVKPCDADDQPFGSLSFGLRVSKDVSHYLTDNEAIDLFKKIHIRLGKADCATELAQSIKSLLRD